MTDWDAIISIAWRIVAVLVLVMLNGFFVAAEFALVKVRDTQLSPLIKKGQRRDRAARAGHPLRRQQLLLRFQHGGAHQGDPGNAAAGRRTIRARASIPAGQKISRC